MKRETVLIRGYKCHLLFGRYNNNTVAMWAVDARTKEDVLVCTVNWESNWQGATNYKATFQFPALVLKDYSENTGVVADLRKAGVIINGGVSMAGTNYGVVCTALTKKWQQIAIQELKYEAAKKG